MKLTILNWLKDAAIPFVGKLIELLFRIILFIMPLGVFLLLIQYRNKASKISNISVFTTDESTWQHIYPGFALVAINPETNKKNIKRIKKNIQATIESNKYFIEIIFMIVVVILLWSRWS